MWRTHSCVPRRHSPETPHDDQVHTDPELHQNLARKYTIWQCSQSEVSAARDGPEGAVRRSCRRWFLVAAMLLCGAANPCCSPIERVLKYRFPPLKLLILGQEIGE